MGLFHCIWCGSSGVNQLDIKIVVDLLKIFFKMYYYKKNNYNQRPDNQSIFSNYRQFLTNRERVLYR